MNLNELKVGEKAIVSYINSSWETMDILGRVMTLGVTPGVELEKLSSVNTCSEYSLENTNIVISKEAAAHIIVVRS